MNIKLDNEDKDKNYNYENVLISKKINDCEQIESSEKMPKLVPNQDGLALDEGVKKFKCDLCDREFGQQSSFQNHVKTIHDSTKTFECDICNTSFISKATYNEHMNVIHKNLIKIECNSCGKTFGRKKQFS